MSELEAIGRRIIATGHTDFRPYDRYGETIEGLSWLPLSPGSETGGAGCYLLRFAPGAASRPHNHTDIEEFLVMEGELEDSDGRVLKPGDYIIYDAGTEHWSRSHEGCVILVFLRQGNRFIDQD